MLAPRPEGRKPERCNFPRRGNAPAWFPCEEPKSPRPPSGGWWQIRIIRPAAPEALDLLLLINLIILAAIVAIFVVPIVFARGQTLKCPNCGEVFKGPLMEERRLGIGWSPPYLGRVVCPACKESRSRRDYQKVRASEAPAPT